MNERDIFVEALKLPDGNERDAFVDRACGDDAAMKQRIASLLSAHAESDKFLESGEELFVAQTKLSDPIAEGPGSVIGPYRLLQQIGEGGFGVVFMAEQTKPVRRKVALKVIKPGMDTRQVIARFEAERQALALMDHPHIAKVYDAGMTPSRLPYFVMELVKGIPITQFCDDHQFSLRERLELFVTVCQAAQHAHQKGIIHRDIKPSNVLVTWHDDRPVVKVIDFGVAKATSGQLTDKTLFTGFMQMLGTPLYMSPEQTALSGVDVDTRSDIYSLGVLLYELLTGTTPFDRERLNAAAMDEVRRIIREEEPHKPSTKVSTQSDSLATLAVQRKMEPKKLGQALRGDLDWIVMKALEKDRTRRYETANGFARDVQRYLADEMVEARPPSSAYRLRKSIRRNKVALTTAGLVSLALIAGTTVSIWQAIRATEQATRATQAEARVTNLLAKETKAREEAQQNLAHARTAVDEFFTHVSQNKLFDVPSLQPLRKDLLEAAIKYYEALVTQYPNDPSLLADLAVARLRIAPIYNDFDRNDDLIDTLAIGLECVERLRREFPNAKREQLRLAGFWKPLRSDGKSARPRNAQKADRTLKQLVDVWESLSRAHPEVVSFQSDLAAAYYALARWQMEIGNATGNLAVLQQGFETADKGIVMWEQLCAAHPDQPDYAANLIEALGDAGYWLKKAGQPERGLELYRRKDQVVDEGIQRYPNVSLFREEYIKRTHAKAHQLEDEGRLPEAETAYQQMLDESMKLRDEFPGAPALSKSICRANLALIRVARSLGRSEAEIETIRRRVAAEIDSLQQLSTEVFHTADEQWQHAQALYELGDFVRQSGETAPSITAYRLCLDVRKDLAEKYPQEPKYRMGAAHAARWLGGLVDGEARRDAWELAEKLLIQLHKDAPDINDYAIFLAHTQMLLGGALYHLGHEELAAEKLRQALTEHRRIWVEHPESQQLLRWEIGASSNDAAWSLVAKSESTTNEAELAVDLAKHAVDLFPDNVAFWNTLGTAQYRAGSWDASEEALRKAMSLNNGGNPWNWFVLAMVTWQRGQHDQARHWFDAACLWTAKYAADNPDLIHFRAEAQSLLEIEQLETDAEIDDAMISRALIAADPQLMSYRLFKGRAEARIREFDWDAAKADAVRATEMRPDDDDLLIRTTSLLARTGDEAAYGQMCRTLLKRHAETTDPQCAERVSKACLTMPIFGEDLEIACRLAEKSVTLDQKHWVVPFGRVSSAMAAYRRGDYAKAIEWCDLALKLEYENVWFRNAQARYVRALSKARLGERDAAQQDFDKAAEIVRQAKSVAKSRPVVDGVWNDFAICEVLQREFLQETAVEAQASDSAEGAQAR